jgi:hypothetical protein
MSTMTSEIDMNLDSSSSLTSPPSRLHGSLSSHDTKSLASVLRSDLREPCGEMAGKAVI